MKGQSRPGKPAADRVVPTTVPARDWGPGEHRTDWSDAVRGQLVWLKRERGIFVGWPGVGSLPWISTFGVGAAQPSQEDWKSFDKLCQAYDKVHGPAISAEIGA